MMKRILIILNILIISLKLLAQTDTICATIDLKNINNDMVNVTMNFNLNQDNINAKFYFPFSIQGTYDYMYYSKYCNNLKAYDKNNNQLKIKELTYKEKRIREYTPQLSYKRIRKKYYNEFFVIPSQTTTLNYKVSDCYDIGKNRFGNFVAEACIFEKNKIFQINWGALLGNFVSKENSFYKIKIIKPEKMYGATTLKKQIINDTIEYVFANSYDDLVNKPIFYTIPDTTTLYIKKSNIEITVFSENGYKYSEKIAKYMKPMLIKATETYLKGIMPEKYTFMFYFSKKFGMGALEHKTTSVYFIVAPDTNDYTLNFLQTPTHEFLHILTPLTVRSEIINNFKFYEPLPSKHLWLYEGVTEYFSNILLLQTKDVKPKWFFNNMLWNYKDGNKKKSLTKLSGNIYKKYWNKKFDLVYSKGSMIAFALDLEIYKLTNGEKRLYDIMMMLKNEYSSKPFDDEKFIDKFVSLCGNQKLNSFFDKYITGKKKLPINNYLRYIGYEYKNVVDTFKYKSAKFKYSQFYKGEKLYIYKPSKKYYPNIKGKRKIELVSINGHKNVIDYSIKLFNLEEGDVIEYKYKDEVKKITVKTFNVTDVSKSKKIVKIMDVSEKQKNTFKKFMNYEYDE